MVLVMRHMVEFKLINVREKTEPLGRQFLCNTVSKKCKKIILQQKFDQSNTPIQHISQ